ncbi:MAG: hypothetical protein ACI8YQ_002452 [Polaribacter sp.]|jgi:hypothetical protein
MNIAQNPIRILTFILLVTPISSFGFSLGFRTIDTTKLEFLFEYPYSSADSVFSSFDKNKEHHNGKSEWLDGVVYEGQFQFGIPHGDGILKWPNGNIYTGHFAKGLRDGFGIQLFYDGSKYEGDWVAEKKEGQGYYLFETGDEYIGEFKNDQVHGEGAILWSNGESYSGFWENGKSHGEGTLVRKDGSKYTGMNEGGERHGEGIITWETGDTLHGTWNNGIMDQEGIFQFADGSSMISYWENGNLLEKVTYVQPNGFKISGSPNQLANLVFKTSLGKGTSIEDNLGLAFYTIGLEFKSTNDFDKAKHYLQFAMEFKDPLESSYIFDLVENQMTSLLSEKENFELINLHVKKKKK